MADPDRADGAAASAAQNQRAAASGQDRGSRAARMSVIAKDATETDLARDISYAPEADPACKDPAPVTAVVKDVGWTVDQLLRSAESVTDEEEERIGEEAFRELARSRRFRRTLDTPSMAADRAYIQEVAKPLVAQAQRKGITYDFHTIDAPEPNAFAIPGGHIFVYRGLLEEPGRIANEAQLAGILAHEMNHVDRRHTIAIFEYIKQLGGSEGGLEEAVIAMARAPFTSKQEEESDRYAVQFLMAAEYSPKQFVSMWQSWGKLEGDEPHDDPLSEVLGAVLDSHPSASKRACQAMRVTMDQQDPAAERYYVGTTNFKQRRARAMQQF